MHPEDEVVAEAATIIANESVLASLQRAVALTLYPPLAETFDTIEKQLNALDKRITQLEIGQQ